MVYIYVQVNKWVYVLFLKNICVQKYFLDWPVITSLKLRATTCPGPKSALLMANKTSEKVKDEIRLNENEDEE